MGLGRRGAGQLGRHSRKRLLPLLLREEASCKTNVDALGSLAVRFGGTIDRALLYVKGGLAWAYETHKISAPGNPIDGFGSFSVEQKHWRWGGMLGAGVEFAFTNTISGKLEYNYMDFGTRTYSFAIAPTVLPTIPLLSTPRSGRASIWSKWA